MEYLKFCEVINLFLLLIIRYHELTKTHLARLDELGSVTIETTFIAK
jgi:hypothetical protein